MRLRERTEDDGSPQPEGASGDDSENLQRVRLAGQSLLAAGADAIERALSGDSEKFLAATRQQGGQ